MTAATLARQRILFSTLLAGLLLVFVLVFVLFRHFLINLALSGSLALVLYPLRHRLTRLLGGRAGLASGLIVALVTVLILVPMLSTAVVLGSQALQFYQWVQPRLAPAQLDALWRERVLPGLPWLEQWQRVNEGALTALVSGALSRLASGVNGLIQGIVAGLTSAAFDLFLFLLMLFFFLRDGHLLVEELRRVSPLSPARERQVLEQVERTTRASLQAMSVVPLAQGLLAALGFWALGVPSALLWGGATLLASFVPLVGTPLVWIPVALFMLATGRPGRALAVVLYGNFVISGVDNLIKPKLLQEGASIHPLLGFLSILGGLRSFGPAGLIVGPVVLTLGIAALRIWEMDVLGLPAAGLPASGPKPVSVPPEPRAEAR
jgi:predicted PurR-regulated permease PerM